MKNLHNARRPILAATIALFLSMTAMAQLTKSQVPNGVLTETKENTPRQMEFNGDKLTLQTDPSKSTGKQYMVEYKITWKGTKFDLKSIQEVSTSINAQGEKETKTVKNSDFFGYSYLKNWSLTTDADGNFILASSAKDDYRWVFKK